MSKIQIDLISDSSEATKATQKLEARVDALTKSSQEMGRKSAKAVKLVSGSMEALERDYKEARKELKQLEVGSDAFDKQKRKVQSLRRELDKANSSTVSALSSTSKGFGVVDRFTGELGVLVGGLGAVSAVVGSLQANFEEIKQERENARLARVDVDRDLALVLSNLAEGERDQLRPLAFNLSKELGLGAGGVAETLGALRSSGAEDLVEAAEFLKEAARAFPQDLAQSAEIAQAGLIEARATGNRDAAQVIGGIVAAQAVSQATSVQDFARAFSANTASAVANLGLTPEQAREEAAIFSILEPKSAEVAATAQNAFFTQLEKFVPSENKKTADGRQVNISAAARQNFLDASVVDRIGLLEEGGNLLEQFVSQLPETGRNAIRRRLNQSQEDAATFQSVRNAIGNDQQSAQQLGRLQQVAQQSAAFAIAAGRQNASQVAFEVLEQQQAAFEGAVVRSNNQILKNSRNAFQRGFEGFGSLVEQTFTDPVGLFTSKGDADQAQRSLEFLARSTEETAETRKAAQAQLEILRELSAAMQLQTIANEKGLADLKAAIQQREGAVQKVEQVNNGPVEAPVPAVGAP